MNFWHMQLHPTGNKDITRDEIIKILKNKGIIGIGSGWRNDRGQPQRFSDEVKIGDIIMIRNHGPLALVKIIGEFQRNNDSDVWFDWIRKIEILSMEGDFYKEKFKEETNLSWSKSLFLPITIGKADASEFIKFWYESIG